MGPSGEGGLIFAGVGKVCWHPEDSSPSELESTSDTETSTPEGTAGHSGWPGD